jgi:hypothetical protein
MTDVLHIDVACCGVRGTVATQMLALKQRPGNPGSFGNGANSDDRLLYDSPELPLVQNERAHGRENPGKRVTRFFLPAGPSPPSVT